MYVCNFDIEDVWSCVRPVRKIYFFEINVKKTPWLIAKLQLQLHLWWGITHSLERQARQKGLRCRQKKIEILKRSWWVSISDMGVTIVRKEVVEKKVFWWVWIFIIKHAWRLCKEPIRYCYGPKNAKCIEMR